MNWRPIATALLTIGGALLACILLSLLMGCGAPTPFKEGPVVLPPIGCEELRKRPDGEC